MKKLKHHKSGKVGVFLGQRSLFFTKCRCIFSFWWENGVFFQHGVFFLQNKTYSVIGGAEKVDAFEFFLIFRCPQISVISTCGTTKIEANARCAILFQLQKNEKITLKLRIEKQALLQHGRTKNVIPTNGRTQHTKKCQKSCEIVTNDTCGVEFRFYNSKSGEL